MHNASVSVVASAKPGARRNARAEPQVLNELTEVFPASRGSLSALVVLDQQVPNGADVTEAGERFSPRLVGRHSQRHIALDAHRDVKVEFLVDVGGNVGPNEAQVAPPARGVAHAIVGAACSTRVTACEYRNQMAASLRRCFRPADVRV